MPFGICSEYTCGRSICSGMHSCSDCDHRAHHRVYLRQHLCTTEHHFRYQQLPHAYSRKCADQSRRNRGWHFNKHYQFCTQRQDLRENIFMLIAIRPKSSFNEVDSYSFVLNISVPEVKNIQRRQSPGGGFINGQGTSTDSCANAAVYTLVNGQLFANVISGTTQFGTDANVDYTVFNPRANLEQSLLPSEWTLRTI